MSNRRPTLQEVINSARDQGARDIYTWIPAKVVKWDASTQRADCQILIKNVTTGEDESRQVVSWPVVCGVPVEFVGAGGFRITCPISDGNTTIEGAVAPATLGSLAFSHRSLDKWLTGGGGEVDPEFDHDHALTDAKFFPGLMPFGAPYSDCPTDHMTIGYDSGQQLHFHGSTIVAGDEAAAQFVALADKVKAWFDAFNGAVSGWVVVANDGGAALKTALSTLVGGSPSTNVAGSVLKAKP